MCNPLTGIVSSYLRRSKKWGYECVGSHLPPPPLMISNSKLKVNQCYGDQAGDNKKNDEDDNQNGVDSVDPVTP